MAETENLPPAGFGADVPHPSVGFSIDVPDHWTMLDLDPATWDVWLDSFLNQRLAGRAHAATERGPIRTEMLWMLRQLQGEGVFLAALLAADADGELLSATATLAWRKLETRGAGIPVAGLREVYLRAPFKPGEDRARRRVEVVDTDWLAVITTTTGNHLLAPNLEEVADGMARSITFEE